MSQTAIEDFRPAEALSPFKAGEWRRLTPRERLRRSWRLRSRIKNPAAWHDGIIFPKP